MSKRRPKDESIAQSSQADNLASALVEAAMLGSLEDVQRLLAAGAPVDGLHPTYGQSALMYAAAYGYVEVLAALVAAGAD
ncbi:MAG: ankyrin repeat domain-containing protein, partial [Verrucomicrobiae bacterium]|nr:ankyrin repeat domain-containing protein [Verrucomicrobiae bacterium]